MSEQLVFAIAFAIAFAVIVSLWVFAIVSNTKLKEKQEERIKIIKLAEAEVYLDLERKVASLTVAEAAYQNEKENSALLYEAIESFDHKTAELIQSHQVELKEARRDAVAKSKAFTKGQIAETFIPFDKDFPFNPKDCQFFGAPIDYVVFRGMEDGKCTKIVFLEVKTGKGQRTKRQNQIKKVIEEGRVEFQTITRKD